MAVGTVYPGTIEIRDLVNGRLITTLTCAPAHATSVHPDQDTAEDDHHRCRVGSGRVRPRWADRRDRRGDGGGSIFDVETGRPVHPLTGHTGEVLTVAFAPGGKTLASGSNDGTIRLWRG